MRTILLYFSRAYSNAFLCRNIGRTCFCWLSDKWLNLLVFSRLTASFDISLSLNTSVVLLDEGFQNTPGLDSLMEQSKVTQDNKPGRWKNESNESMNKMDE